MGKERYKKPIEHVVDENGCWICTSHATDMHGYPHVWRNNRGQNAHRFIYEQIHGPLPSDVVVRHTCDVRRCINPSHLIRGSHADNSNDCKVRGRLNTPRGESRSDAKLTDAQVLEIRNAQGISQAKLATQYGVNQSTISRIRGGTKRVYLGNDGRPDQALDEG